MRVGRHAYVCKHEYVHTLKICTVRVEGHAATGTYRMRAHARIIQRLLAHTDYRFEGR